MLGVDTERTRGVVGQLRHTYTRLVDDPGLQEFQERFALRDFIVATSSERKRKRKKCDRGRHSAAARPCLPSSIGRT